MSTVRVASPIPSTIRGEAACEECGGLIVRTPPSNGHVFPWYHAATGNEACA